MKKISFFTALSLGLSSLTWAAPDPEAASFLEKEDEEQGLKEPVSDEQPLEKDLQEDLSEDFSDPLVYKKIVSKIFSKDSAPSQELLSKFFASLKRKRDFQNRVEEFDKLFKKTVKPEGNQIKSYLKDISAELDAEGNLVRPYSGDELYQIMQRWSNVNDVASTREDFERLIDLEEARDKAFNTFRNSPFFVPTTDDKVLEAKGELRAAKQAMADGTGTLEQVNKARAAYNEALANRKDEAEGTRDQETDAHETN